MTENYLVLGASGFVGSALVEHLRGAGVMVTTATTPRLRAATKTSVGTLAQTARHHPAVADLAATMRGMSVVVVAAGVATPGAALTPELVGGNSLLPGVVAVAARRAGVRRVVHLSSAAVQGRSRSLDESERVQPFSAYSQSKAMGERVARLLAEETGADVVVLRATSVQGSGRATTAGLQRFARSRLASVAGNGTAPPAVSSVAALCEFIAVVAGRPEPVPPIVLQPWEQLSVADVIRLAGGREPITLPRPLCALSVAGGYAFSAVLGGRLHGQVRRVEALWFGQQVNAHWAQRIGITVRSRLRDVLVR
jgi:nucleoside-diphosphate-sugar epimerase